MKSVKKGKKIEINNSNNKEKMTRVESAGFNEFLKTAKLIKLSVCAKLN